MFVCIRSRTQFTFCLFFFINFSSVTTSGSKMKIVCFYKNPEKGRKNGRNWISWLINLDLMSWKATPIESCRGDCMQISRTIVRRHQPPRTRGECQPSTMINDFCLRRVCKSKLIHNSLPKKRTVCYGRRTSKWMSMSWIGKKLCCRFRVAAIGKYFDQLALRSR